jgi:hypothetical protein
MWPFQDWIGTTNATNQDITTDYHVAPEPLYREERRHPPESVMDASNEKLRKLFQPED